MDESIVEKVTQALANPNYEWRTAGGIAQESGLPEDLVTAALSSMAERIVKASLRSRDGKELFASRDRFDREGRIGDKLRGAILNRRA